MTETKNISHSIYTLPVLNWFLFSESLQDGDPDFSLLFSVSNNEISKEIGFETYKNIVSKMPFLSFDLQKTELSLKLASNMLLITHLQKKYNKNLEQKCNNFASAYCHQLDTDNIGFNITIHSSVKNYKKVWKKLYGDLSIPKKLDKLLTDGITFSHPLLFNILAKNHFPDNSEIILNEIFLTNFIEKKEVKIKSIFEYILPLQKYFISKDNFKEFVFLRPTFLTLSENQKIKKSKRSGVSELYETLFNLEQFAKIKINPQKDSLFTFVTYVEKANQLAKKQKENKPNAK